MFSLFPIVFAFGLTIQGSNAQGGLALASATMKTSTSCPVGTIVKNMTATSGTGTAPYSYSIDTTTAPSTQKLFTVLANGTVSVKDTLGSQPAAYNVSIKVTDSAAGTATGLLTITVEDNKATPTFTQSSYCVVVPSNATTGANVGIFNATDTDKAAPSNTIAYAIVDGDTTQKFDIADKTIGKITTKATLDKSKTPSYTLTVSATDGATCPLVSQATVIVKLDGSCSSAVSRISGTLIAMGTALLWYILQLV